MNQQTHRQALPKGYMLQEYQVDRVLGAGGFGLTYLGWDTALEKPVAVKEYLPNDLAVRETNHSVAAKSRDDEDNFRWGLTRFLDEARTLARFKHPNIVSVYRYFEAHGTAYIVMEFVEGETFGAYLKRAGKPKESFLRAVLIALLDGLAEVHRAGFMHRDIKPGNILLNAKGAPVLVDFGSARQEIGGRSRSITSVVTPGYAPIEQYSSRGNQGPWTDIYALGAVAYRAITGEAPPDATERVRKDPMTPATDAARGKYSAKFLAAVDWALAVDEDKRPQDVDAWRGALTDETQTEKPAAVEPLAVARHVRGFFSGPMDEAPVEKFGSGREKAVKNLAPTWGQMLCDARLPSKPEVKPEVKRKVETKSSGGGWAVAILCILVIGGLLLAEWGQDAARQESARVEARVQTAEEKRRAESAVKWDVEEAEREVAIARLMPKCNEPPEWDDGPCWHKVKNRPGCYLWDEVYFGLIVEWSGHCKNGMADGRGEESWLTNKADNNDNAGSYLNGKKHGQWIEWGEIGSVDEGPYVDGKRHGRWVEGFGRRVREGIYVNGKEHGRWITRNADHEVHYVDGKMRSRWVIRNANITVRTTCYENGDEIDC